jgi:hypothetical protein
MDLLVHTVDALALDRYMGVVGATIWAYDYILTISDEVTLVWSRVFSFIKALYFVVSAIYRLHHRIGHWPSSRPTLGWLLGSY